MKGSVKQTSVKWGHCIVLYGRCVVLVGRRESRFKIGGRIDGVV